MSYQPKEPKPCNKCGCPVMWDSSIDKTFTKKDGSQGKGWWREDLSKEQHTKERCEQMQKNNEWTKPEPQTKVTQTWDSMIPELGEAEKQVIEGIKKKAFFEAAACLAVLESVEAVCRAKGITEPPRIGMVYNAVIRSMSRND